MTEPYITAERAVELIRWWAPRLGLSGWHIVVKIGLDGVADSVAGRVETSDRYDYAVIRFAESPPEEWRSHPHAAESTVVHELLHLVNRSAHDEVYRIVGEHVRAKRRSKTTWRRYLDLHEGAIQRQADALVATRHGLPDEMPVPVIGEAIP